MYARWKRWYNFGKWQGLKHQEAEDFASFVVETYLRSKTKQINLNFVYIDWIRITKGYPGKYNETIKNIKNPLYVDDIGPFSEFIAATVSNNYSKISHYLDFIKDDKTKAMFILHYGFDFSYMKIGFLFNTHERTVINKLKEVRKTLETFFVNGGIE